MTYHPLLPLLELLFVGLLLLHDCLLNLATVISVALLLASHALLGQLSVVHRVLGLVNGVCSWDDLHSSHSALLALVECDLGDVLDLRLDELLVMCWRCQQCRIHFLD